MDGCTQKLSYEGNLGFCHKCGSSDHCMVNCIFSPIMSRRQTAPRRFSPPNSNSNLNLNLPPTRAGNLLSKHTSTNHVVTQLTKGNQPTIGMTSTPKSTKDKGKAPATLLNKSTKDKGKAPLTLLNKKSSGIIKKSSHHSSVRKLIGPPEASTSCITFLSNPSPYVKPQNDQGAPNPNGHVEERLDLAIVPFSYANCHQPQCPTSFDLTHEMTPAPYDVAPSPKTLFCTPTTNLSSILIDTPSPPPPFCLRKMNIPYPALILDAL